MTEGIDAAVFNGAIRLLAVQRKERIVQRTTFNRGMTWKI